MLESISDLPGDYCTYEVLDLNQFFCYFFFQVFVYNESVIQGGQRRNLVDLFVDVATKFDDVVRHIFLICFFFLFIIIVFSIFALYFNGGK